MSDSLAPCRPLLDSDPLLYIDLTEAVRRGIGRVISALPFGALVAYDSYQQDGVDYGFTMCAGRRKTAENLCALLPEWASFVVVHEDFYHDLVKARCGLIMGEPCWQAAYIRKTPLPLPELPGVAIRPLALANLPLAAKHYALENEDYLRCLTERGNLFGAYDGGTLLGFCGCHAEGSMGLLEVFPPYRRRGLARLLQSYVVDLELSRGHIPYCQVFDGNKASIRLQKSLRLEIADAPVYWDWKAEPRDT